jgi:hypothetical protein
MKKRKEELEKEEGKKTLLKYMYQGHYSMNAVKN